MTRVLGFAVHIFEEFTARIRSVVKDLWSLAPSDPCWSRILVEAPREDKHGDLSTNAAMVLAKTLQMKPLQIATMIADEIKYDRDIASVEVLEPGFINMSLNNSCFSRVVRKILIEGMNYGRKPPNSIRLNLESVSANPTGPMHLGHCRGAIFADVLANLLVFSGYEVTKEYYVNDTGVQIADLVKSVYLRYLECLGEDIGDMPANLYTGDYLKPVGRSLVEKFGTMLKEVEEKKQIELIEPLVVDKMMDSIKADLSLLGIRHDVFFSEKSLHAGPEGDRVAAAIEQLIQKGAIYRGRLTPPKGGEKIEDWEDREQLLFRSSDYGDDLDRPLIKSDGSYTYFASDVAYHYDKYLRGFLNQINVFGADHSGYITRLRAALKAISDGEVELDVKVCQLVRLLRNRKPVRMSKRSGGFITCRELLEEVGIDALRFMMLWRKNDAHMDFDLQEAIAQSKDNPVFYVQYAHARAVSVLHQMQKSEQALPGIPTSKEGIEFVSQECLGSFLEADFTVLTDRGEVRLIRRLIEWPRIVEMATQAREPHHIASYLHGLANEFHVHWHRGRDNKDLRFILSEDRSLTMARLGLVTCIGLVLSLGLSILGVTAPKEMQ